MCHATWRSLWASPSCNAGAPWTWWIGREPCSRRRHLHWAGRWDLLLLPALLMGAADPLEVAQRLQLPTAQQRLMAQTLALQDWLRGD